MGSRLALTLAGDGVSSGAADAAWRGVVEEFEATERALSRFRTDSELSLLNARAGDGEWIRIGHRLWACLAAARRAQRITGGRFDPRVITILEALGERAGVPLPAHSVAAERPFADLDPRQRHARLWHPIDSGGIGKGLALRWSATRLNRQLPAAGFLLDAGGDITLRGPSPHGGMWRIAIEDPLGGDDPIAVLAVEHGAVMTSSVAVRHWLDEAGRPVHHLIDPRRGAPADSGLAAVTVAGSDPAWAEVWSKALFLAGVRLIGPEARARGLAAWWVDSDGKIGMTPAAWALTAWARDDRAS